MNAASYKFVNPPGLCLLGAILELEQCNMDCIHFLNGGPCMSCCWIIL